MIYLSSFKLSDRKIKNPNIYPYSVFRDKYTEPFVFAPITILYGNNGSGKSTILNLIADKLEIKGRERATSNSFGITDYVEQFIEECGIAYGEDEDGEPYYKVPDTSRYIKSEDVLYEIKKIQQRKVLGEGIAQEKYSNGETSMQYFDAYLQPDALYLLDEPEVSLSPANQVKLAEEINKLARLLGCQFIIATHSPFMLGTLQAKIYNIDLKEYEVVKWSKLENIRYFYDFFKKHEGEFE